MQRWTLFTLQIFDLCRHLSMLALATDTTASVLLLARPSSRYQAMEVGVAIEKSEEDERQCCRYCAGAVGLLIVT